MNGYEYLIKKRNALLSSGGLFWLPSGMSYDNVLAAYQFKGVASENEARSDVSGHGLTLTKTTQSYSGTSHTPEWNSSYGYKFDAAYQGNTGFLDNSTLDAQDIVSAVVRFSNVSDSYDRTYLITAGGSSGLAQLMARSAIYDGEVKTYAGGGYASSTSGSGKWNTSSSFKSEGVFGANFGSNSKLYYNGSHIGTTERSGEVSLPSKATFGSFHANKSDLYNAVHGGKRIQAAVFFKVALSEDQHLEVAQRMLEL